MTDPRIAPSVPVSWCDRCRLKHYGDHVCDLGPVTFERRELRDYGFAREVTYRAYCPTCNSAFDIKTESKNVERPTEQEMEEVADPTVGVRGDVAGWLSLMDRMFGNHARRRELEEQNRKVDAFEKMLRERAMRQLGEICPHARAR